MKILHVITSLQTGGAETLVVNLMPRFHALGHEVGAVVFNAVRTSLMERIAFYYQQIKDNPAFGGVCGYMAHHDGTVIGRGNDMPVLDTNSIDLRYKFHVEGDMLEVFRTFSFERDSFPRNKRREICSRGFSMESYCM